ncbi:hypothetical protein [Salirhabdus salicampi]|uniref:hypothetical protein n=1 Tax=Salirhabdus salicampi TaxID=476102 RepID=UPI0020C4629B|nr:hypothetical protein [Salirhabdus salicampi]MCP8615721.1 hypothetical protein [Salirhabdus salicampi]
MNILKYILFTLCVSAQLLGFVYLFINVKIAVTLILANVVFFIFLIMVFVKERVDEKKEENDDDYRDY